MIAVISTLGMVGLLVSMDDTSAREAVTLAKKVENSKLAKNSSGLKKKLEDENQELVEKKNLDLLKKKSLL